MSVDINKNTYKSTYNILSIDGGGLRGIIPLVVLENLEKYSPDFLKKVDMFAGTSTGGLIALGLAKGMKPLEILDLYIFHGPQIFQRSLWLEIKNLNDAIGPKYDDISREALCQSILQDLRLKDFLDHDHKKGHVLITAFDLDDKVHSELNLRRWKAKIFHNLPTNNHSDDGDEIAYRIAMRTTASPTYFASYDGFVDGGIFANNPSMCAIAQTQDARLAQQIPLSSIRMLSLGTGYCPSYIDGEERWGLAQWAPKLADILADGINKVADFQARQMLGENHYHRITTQLIDQIAMDDVSKIAELQRIGNAIDISQASVFIDQWE
jgi:patatin-like phospholipase/acyl hydrolase